MIENVTTEVEKKMQILCILKMTLCFLFFNRKALFEEEVLFELKML